MQLDQDCAQQQVFLLLALTLQVPLPESCQQGYLMVNNQSLIPSKDKNFTLCH
jgi:hypothetical protein